MYSGLSDIRLLSFVCAIKALRRNSVIYSHDRAYKLSPLLSIAPQTFNKYMAALDDLGLIRHTARGHRVIVSLSDCAKVLLPEWGAGRCHIRFFAAFDKVPNVKYYEDHIRFAIAKLNYTQQRYHAGRKQHLIRNCTNLASSNLTRALNKYRAKDVADITRILNPYVVTGKYHLSNLMGCSPGTAARLLRFWTAGKRIARTIVQKCFYGFTHANFDSLKEEGYKYVYPNRRKDMYIATIGSVIEIL